MQFDRLQTEQVHPDSLTLDTLTPLEISTLTMVQLGKVYGNLMVDMRPTNTKLQDRAVRMVMKALNLPRDQAETLYKVSGNSVKAAILMHETGVSADTASHALAQHGGFVRQALEALRG